VRSPEDYEMDSDGDVVAMSCQDTNYYNLYGMLWKGYIYYIILSQRHHISGTLWDVPKIMKWTVMEMWLQWVVKIQIMCYTCNIYGMLWKRYHNSYLWHNIVTMTPYSCTLWDVPKIMRLTVMDMWLRWDLQYFVLIVCMMAILYSIP